MASLLDQAMELATAAHAGQLDKAGRPYILHPAAVAALCQNEDEKIVAWLHDVLEDTDVTAEELSRIFPEYIVEAVCSLTRHPNEDYMDFIRRAEKNPLAKTVKRADLTHNSDLARLPQVTEKDLRRLEKYRAAMEVLQGEDDTAP